MHVATTWSSQEEPHHPRPYRQHEIRRKNDWRFWIRMGGTGVRRPLDAPGKTASSYFLGTFCDDKFSLEFDSDLKCSQMAGVVVEVGSNPVERIQLNDSFVSQILMHLEEGGHRTCSHRWLGNNLLIWSD